MRSEIDGVAKAATVGGFGNGLIVRRLHTLRQGVKPTIAAGREQWANKQFLANLEKAAERFEAWMEKRSPGHVARMRDFMKQMQSQMKKAA